MSSNTIQFTSCTPLISSGPGGGYEHRFRLSWSYSPGALGNFKKINIYRYIGAVGSCGFPRNFDFADKYIIKQITSNFSTTISYIDNLSGYYYGAPPGALLKNIYNDPSKSDKQILDEVYATQRPLYYILKEESDSGYDGLPYVLIVHTSNGKVQCVSTKTQVKHDMLHSEGDRIWITQLRSPEGIARNISRTAVDVTRITNDPTTHAGAAGYGGWVWITDRYHLYKDSKVYAFKCSLKNGQELNAFNCTPGQNKISDYPPDELPADPPHGCGIAINYNTGDAYVGTFYGAYKNNAHLYSCISESTTGTYTAPKTLVYNYHGANYGLATAPDDPNTYFCVIGPTQRAPSGGSGSRRSVNVIKNNGTSWSCQLLYNNYTSYGLAVGKDGTLFTSRFYGNRQTPQQDDRIVDYAYKSGSTYITKRGQVFPSTVPNKGCKGITVDFPNLYPNTNSDNYKVFVAGCENKNMGYSLFNVTTKNFEGGQGKVDLSFQPNGIGCDSENNIWVIGGAKNSSGNIVKFYQLSADDIYPYGGFCRYPTVGINDWPSSNTNTREIEWFLTRETSCMAATPLAEWHALVKDFETVEYGIEGSTNTVYGSALNSANTVTDIEDWYTDHGGDNFNISGKRVYPNYTNQNQLVYFPKRYYVNNESGATLSYSYEYSDFTGNLLLGKSIASTSYTYTHPSPTDPSVELIISEATQDSPLQEPAISQWQDTQYNTNYTQASGYDDLSVVYRAVANPGTYVLSSWDFDYNDYYSDVDETININTYSVNNNQQYVVANNYITTVSAAHTYHDPNRFGISGDIQWFTASGIFAPIVSAHGNFNPYACSSINVVSNNTEIVVSERWPEAGLVIKHEDSLAERLDWFGCPMLRWKPTSRFDKDLDYTIPTNIYTRNNIAYGTDMLSATIYDTSLARSYAVTGWLLEISASNIWNSENFAGWTAAPVGSNWTHISAVYIETDLLTKLPSDTANSENRGSDALLLKLNEYRYGPYVFTVNVCAASPKDSGTPSMSSFTQYLCVKEFEPFANFWAISAFTVPSDYSDETLNNKASDLISYEYAQIPNGVYNYVSGYAPNVTVYFMDSSEPHTFPISSYHWNFGDYYTEDTDNEYVVEATEASLVGTFKSGCWRTDVTCHTAVHTYVMPGIYDVTLTVEASNTSTQDVCARSTSDTEFYVYVKEIPPTCCLSAVSATGISPFTAYFTTSCSVPGSFPICRLDFDFGDDSEVETITRIPYTTALSDGSILVDGGYYPLSAHDPRNWLIPHIYTVTGQEYDTFIAQVSVYACNTNTMAGPCSALMGPIYSTDAELPLDKRHLIANRFMNTEDLVYLFEGEESKTTFTVVLSTSQ